MSRQTRPTEYPRWATGGSAQITDPTSGKKDLGWSVAEKPPAQFFNWLLNLIYQWVLYTMYTPTALSDLTPQTEWQDFNGNVRSLVDHNGYPMGLRTELRESWQYVPLSSLSAGTYTVFGDRYVAVLTRGTGGSPNAQANVSFHSETGYSAPTGIITAGTGGGGGDLALLKTGNTICLGAESFKTQVLEFEAFISNSSATNKTYYLGFVQSNTTGIVPSGDDCIAFYYDANGSGGNWQVITQTGGTQSVGSTGVALTNNTLYKLRIELQGSSITGGSSSALFYINGALVATLTASLPTATAMSIGFQNGGASSSLSSILTVSPYLYNGNRVLSLTEF